MSDLLSEKCGQPSVLRAEDWSEMAERICAWPLPDDLCADAIACKPGAPHRTGTNLITTTQALAMLDYACKPIIDAALTAERERADRAEDEIARRHGIGGELIIARRERDEARNELAALREQVARLVGALEQIAQLDYTRGAVNMAATKANAIARAALGEGK